MTGKKLKVLFITQWYPNPEDIQLGEFIRKHAKAISLFADITLLHVQSLGNEFRNEIGIHNSSYDDIDEVKIYFQKSTYPLIGRVINAFRYFRSVKKGLKLILEKNHDFDLTHAYILPRTIFISWRIFNKLNVPFVVSEQQSAFLTGEFYRWSIITKWFLRKTIRHSKGIHTVSKTLKEKMESCGLNNRYTIIPNCVDLNLIQLPSKKNTIKKILVVADLVDDIKNISGAIKSFANTEEIYSKAELHIAGGGRDEKMLKALSDSFQNVSNRIFFYGRIDNKKVFELLSQSDVLVVNSRFETFSAICIEAMASGIPVIATKCGGPQEIITTETGVLIDVDSSEQLTSSLRKIIWEEITFNPELLRNHVQQHYSLEGVSHQFMEFYKNALTC